MDTIACKKTNTKQVNWWFPIITQKSNTQEMPLAIMVNFYGKDLIGIDDFTEKTGISLKNYLKLTLRTTEPEINLNKDNDIKLLQ